MTMDSLSLVVLLCNFEFICQFVLWIVFMRVHVPS